MESNKLLQTKAQYCCTRSKAPDMIIPINGLVICRVLNRGKVMTQNPSHTSDHPYRPTDDAITIIKSELVGSPHDPNFNELTIRINKNNHFVVLRLVHVGVENWQYDINGARLSDDKGSPIKGKAGELNKADRELLVTQFAVKATSKNLQEPVP